MTTLVDRYISKSRKKGWVKRPVLFFVLTAALFSGFLFGFSCEPSAPQVKLQEIRGRAMGTTFIVKWYVPGSVSSDSGDLGSVSADDLNTPEKKRSEAAPLLKKEKPSNAQNPSREEVEKSVLAALEKINQVASTYSKESELSKWNRRRQSAPVLISYDLSTMLSIAEVIFLKTDGLYDVTAAPLVNLWGFGPGQGRESPPSEAEIAQVLKQVGMGSVGHSRDSKGRMTLGKENLLVQVDLSSVAKGYAVDEVARELDKLGIGYYMVELGGEIRVKGGGSRSGLPLWRLGVQAPGQKEPVQVLLDEGTLATSGNYLNFFRYDSKLYSHIINPKTGYPVENEVVMASVVADECAWADAWATALMALGLEQARKVALDEGLAVFIVSRKDEKFESWYSPGYQKFLAGRR